MSLDEFLAGIEASISENETIPIPDALEDMFVEARAIWDAHDREHAFRDFIPADYHKIFRALSLFQGRFDTFLEWGSGLGVIANIASHLGFTAYGIEIDPVLVERSRQIAKQFGSSAKFSTGSFIPDAYQWRGVHGDDFFRTVLDECDGYGELDMELRDFDLVYGYPWPGEHEFFYDIMRQCAGKHTLFMTFDIREGIRVERVKQKR